jgi:carboxymethylenebutenolidase
MDLSSNITTEGIRNCVYKVENQEDGQGYLSPENSSSEYGIVLIQEWWGMNLSITLTADKFSKHGYRVLCPDMYRGKVGKNNEEAGHLMSNLDWASALLVIKGAGEYLRSLGCKKVYLTGFCMGGALTIATISTYGTIFDGAAPFYGVPDLTKFDIGNAKCSILAHFGDLDKHAGFSDIATAKNLESVALAKGLNFKLRIWENVDHAFMNQDSPRYNSEAASKALAETVEFFKSL